MFKNIENFHVIISCLFGSNKNIKKHLLSLIIGNKKLGFRSEYLWTWSLLPNYAF